MVGGVDVNALTPMHPEASKFAHGAYLFAVGALVIRLAHLDEWSIVTWLVLAAFVATVRPDRVPTPSAKTLAMGVVAFASISFAVAYLPDLWFAIAYRLNHAQHYLLDANRLMRALPGNDGRIVWGHAVEPISRVMRWIYRTGFDLVVWIPVVRSLFAFDVRKVMRYALGSHLIQFPLILPFYSSIRADEVWSVLGDPDRLHRGWSNEMRLDLGANCFPSMHTSVAFAILVLAARERSPAYRIMMTIYATSIIFSTVYLEIHWLMDVAGGVLLGIAAVRVTDLLLAEISGDAAPRQARSRRRFAGLQSLTLTSILPS